MYSFSVGLKEASLQFALYGYTPHKRGYENKFHFYHPYNVSLHTAYRKIENPFHSSYTNLLRCYHRTDTTNTRDARLIRRAPVLGILALLIKFIKKTAWVQELTYRNKAYKHSKTLFFIRNNKTMSFPVTLSTPPSTDYIQSLIKHMECNLFPLFPQLLNVVLAFWRTWHPTCTLPSFTFKTEMRSTDSNNNDRNLYGDAKLWDVTKFPSPNWLFSFIKKKCSLQSNY